ncbi:MAG: ABC transporter ATP-binding protein [Acholeplasmatales bacterium]|jgi:ABC-2 type transport system ATP-binding protein|nr:ABC transporter ATP-binding protein [Acholeplasmatales bacterium]
MVLECRDVVKRYGQKEALKGVSFELEAGKIIGLLGPNGSGKTTLIKIINGLLSKNSGSISVCGHPVGVESKKRISYLPERTYLNLDMKVKECIQMFKDFYQDFDDKKALELVKKLSVDPDEKMKHLSKGTKEKVQLILVMSRNADLYILDEPIAGVDPAARDLILNLIISNLNPKASLLICTHLIYDIESILDDVIFINEGRIILHRNADELRSQYNGSINDAFREAFKCF